MSDEQDFFFDEETEKTTKTRKAPAPKSSPAPSDEAYEDGGVFSQQVTMAVAALMTIVALLVGVIVGYLIPKGATQGAAATAITTPTDGQAGPLPSGTDTSKLPDGHPDISGATGGSTSTTQTK